MAFDDCSVRDGSLIWDPILARPGDVIVCPEGHIICDVVGTVRLHDNMVRTADFANWRGGSSPKKGDGRPHCHVCGEPLFLTGWGENRPITQDGVRLLPEDPGYAETPFRGEE